MVKRYVSNTSVQMSQDVSGFWIAYEDYLALKAALDEALAHWDILLTGKAKPLIFEHRKRILELRKFLDDK